jgi:hypothetical protein
MWEKTWHLSFTVWLIPLTLIISPSFILQMT